MELHPDRNLNDTENATRKFAEVQTAYEILSDPQERAWYDSHRDAILGGDPDVGSAEPSGLSGGRYTSAATIFSLMGRFNSSVPMDDSPSGFFGILNGFFDQLASEENIASDWGGTEPIDYPPFANAKGDYDSVAKPFYRAWSSFSTKKSFSWKDRYRTTDAPDRRVRRLMEKENKKFREDGIREFNDAVQSLVAFVKKRDPRYVPNTQSESERQQILRNSAAAQAARDRAANQEKLAQYAVPEWARSRDDGDQLSEFSETEEESEIEHFECVVCNKIFKSEKQFEAHEKSKKHIKAVQQLRRRMKKENADLDLDDMESPHSTDEKASASAPATPANEIEPWSPQVSGKTKGEHVPQGLPAEQDEPLNLSSTDEAEDDEYAPRSSVETRILSEESKKAKSGNGIEDASLASATASVSNLSLEESTPAKKIGKAKLKREKKAARRAVSTSTQESVSEPNGTIRYFRRATTSTGSNLDPNQHNCAVCSTTFASRTKLFAHIKELNHAAPVSQSSKKRGG